MATPEDLELIRAGYHANWLPEKLRDNLWEYTRTREPYFVKFRGHDLKTRPKINFADPNERGEYPLYRWGQERQSYDLVEKIPPPVRAVMDFIEAQFGAKTNLAMATYCSSRQENNHRLAWTRGDRRPHLQRVPRSCEAFLGNATGEPRQNRSEGNRHSCRVPHATRRSVRPGRGRQQTLWSRCAWRSTRKGLASIVGFSNSERLFCQPSRANVQRGCWQGAADQTRRRGNC